MEKRRSLMALDLVNFFQADVHTGVGPFLAIYLLSSQHWDQATIGIVIGAVSLAAVVAQTPAGAVVDVTRRKRLLMAAASLIVAAGSLLIVLAPTFYPVLTAQILIGVCSTVFGPDIAAITLGLVGRNKLDTRVGRNEGSNHAGNVFTALAAGGIGYYFGQQWIFYFVAAICIATIVAIFAIRERDIDHNLARGSVDGEAEPKIMPIRTLLSDRRILYFLISIVLFHFANAAMLTLVGEELSQDSKAAPLYMAACIVVAQTVMTPVAILCGKLTGKWGRKPLFLIGFLILPIRGILYTLTSNPHLLISVQILDGFGAAIFGVLGVLVVADLTKGTGRFNLTQGLIATALGVGSMLSNVTAGYIVKHAGYNAAFLTLAGVAVVALIFYWWKMPETKPAMEELPSRRFSARLRSAS